MMMDDNDDVKAGREFHTNKDIGVKAQMERVKWLLATPHPRTLPTFENDKQAKQWINDRSPVISAGFVLLVRLFSFKLLIFLQFLLFLYIILILSHPSAGHYLYSVIAGLRE